MVPKAADHAQVKVGLEAVAELVMTNPEEAVDTLEAQAVPMIVMVAEEAPLAMVPTQPLLEVRITLMVISSSTSPSQPHALQTLSSAIRKQRLYEKEIGIFVPISFFNFDVG